MLLFNHTLLRQRYWRWLPPLLLGLALAASTVSHAQANDVQQAVVTLRDAADHGLDQAVITLQSPEGNVLAEGVTDQDGNTRLSFPSSTDALRLVVRGVSAKGTPLQLASSERDGITVRLLTPTTAIALRVEDDGTVMPDPATMAEPAWIPLPPVPTRQLPAPHSPTGTISALSTAEPRSTAAATAQQPAPAEFVDANGQPIADTPPTPADVELLVGLAWLVSVIAVAVWLILRPVRGG